jgi:hypothetical protein
MGLGAWRSCPLRGLSRFGACRSIDGMWPVGWGSSGQLKGLEFLLSWGTLGSTQARGLGCLWYNSGLIWIRGLLGPWDLVALLRVFCRRVWLYVLRSPTPFLKLVPIEIKGDMS